MYKIVDITSCNLALYPQAICFINPKHEHYRHKVIWLKERFKEGLTQKVLIKEGDKKICSFIEYVPGAFAWRAVHAPKHMFIHCIWTNQNKNKNKGFAGALLRAAITDAEEKKMDGIAAITSSGSFMADKALFLKNGFTQIEKNGNLALLCLNFKNDAEPPTLAIHDFTGRYPGWHIIYSKQCPWVARFVEEIKPMLKKEKLDIEMHEIKSAQDAQNAPSVYSAFTLIKDDQILADHYISITRFMNIVRKAGK